MSETQPNRFSLKVWKKDMGKKIVANLEFHFIICDMSISDSYPSNYFCRLPINFQLNNSQKSKIIKLLGVSEAKILCKSLLENALATEQDAETKSEIQHRLKLLLPSQKLIICPSCGESFKPRNLYGRKQVYCDSCRVKNRKPEKTLETAKCEMCGLSYVKHQPNQKFCCRKCRDKASNLKKPFLGSISPKIEKLREGDRFESG